MVTVDAAQVRYKVMDQNLKYTAFLGDNHGQLIMCIPGCGGTSKSQLILL